MTRPTLSMRQVATHNTPEDCWVVIHGLVYDLTEFHRHHPGGSKIITDCAGKDATPQFDLIHPKDIMQRLLSPDVIMGAVDPSTVTPDDVCEVPSDSNANGGQTADWVKPPINTMLNTFDFEAVARQTMGKQGWYYYSSGADDEITLRENHAAFHRIWLKPRVLVNVATVDTSTKVLGFDSNLPLYVTATALGKLAHPDGEVAITRACARTGVLQMMPTLSSCSLDEMLEAREPDQIVFSQLYVNPDRSRNLEYIKRLEAANVKALFITVDAPQLGRREKDMRNKFSLQVSSVQVEDEKQGKVDRDQGIANALSSFIDTALCWEDLAFFKEHTDLPIFLKGIQCGEDAVLALKHGCRGIVVSNHGGRQLDMARSAIEVLPEVMDALRKCDSYSKSSFEVYIDGGIRRGADIFKAIALGATAVGIGRPSIYGLAAYGQQGVERVVQVLKEELEVCMRLMGVTRIQDINESCVITRNLQDHFASQPSDSLMNSTYEPLRTQAKL